MRLNPMTVAALLLVTMLVLPSAPAAAGPVAPPCQRWGVLADSYGTDLSELDAAEAAAGARVDLFGFYQGWASGEPFDRARADAVTARGAIPVLAWEPYDWQAGTEQPEFALSRILRGDHDAYIRSWARDITAWGKPLMLRFAYEMNGDWMPWSEGVNGNRPGEYVAAWRHVHRIFASEGAANVSWVWAPNVAYSGSTPLEGLYPGDDYVDWLGVSGYNWGTGVTEWHTWQSVEDVFGATLAELRSLATKPIIITETASAESGGDKAAWIRDLFPALGRHPDVAAVMWFNYDKETDWRIQSSAAARDAFKASLAEARRRCGSTGDLGVQRIDAGDPAAAAIAVSRSRYAQRGAARHVVLSRDDAFPDALAGSALTGDGPLLLTARDRLAASTLAEIKRVLPGGGRVYLLGGTQALSESVRRELEGHGYRPARLAGRDRVETALAVASEVRRLHGGDRVVVARAFASGGDPTSAWADSVAVGAWAARTATPVLLTGSARLHPSVARWLDANPARRSYLVGGSAALSGAVEAGLPGAARLAGPTRLETAAAVASRLWGARSWDRRQFTVVNAHREDGWAFGLAAAGLGADRLAPLLLAGNEAVPAEARRLVGCPLLGSDVTLVGSAGVVPPAVPAALAGSC